MIEVWLIVTMCAATLPSAMPYGQEGAVQAHDCAEYRSDEAFASFGQYRLEQERLRNLPLEGRRITAFLCSRFITAERVAELPPLSSAYGDRV